MTLMATTAIAIAYKWCWIKKFNVQQNKLNIRLANNNA